jgi:4-hydroxy-2-oxoheptanedioate aldolase
MINTAEEAAEFVSYMRYPPRGQRSFGPTRAGVAIPGYGPAMNDEVVALAMIETADGVKNLQAIAATPGLDGIYVGPADLTLGTQDGRLPPGLDREEPEMVELIQQIAQTCAENGIKACIHCGTPEYAARAIEWGYALTTVSGDARLLAAGASASIARFRELTGGAGAKAESGGMY